MLHMVLYFVIMEFVLLVEIKITVLRYGSLFVKICEFALVKSSVKLVFLQNPVIIRRKMAKVASHYFARYLI